MENTCIDEGQVSFAFHVSLQGGKDYITDKSV